jgi:hypothetical protein
MAMRDVQRIVATLSADCSASSYAQSIALQSYGWDGAVNRLKHDADHGETNEGSDGSGIAFEITR